MDDGEIKEKHSKTKKRLLLKLVIEFLYKDKTI